MAAAIDSTFYHDGGMAKTATVNNLKRKMTLDLNSDRTKQQKFQSMLSSPDMNMLKLASPELEKMIISQNGMVTTTPTPTQFICPKYVSEEQEAYAKGFVDALNELHHNQFQTTASVVPPANNVTYTTLTTVGATETSSVPSTTTSLPGSVIPATSRSQPAYSRLLQLKEEPQIVPCLGETPPMSPINMDVQEVVKLERKRARNRVAARKCRTRKLERISRLEDRVGELKGQNNQLVDTATKLRDQVFKLKQQIMEHVNSGCQVMLSPNISL